MNICRLFRPWLSVAFVMASWGSSLDLCVEVEISKEISSQISLINDLWAVIMLTAAIFLSVIFEWLVLIIAYFLSALKLQ